VPVRFLSFLAAALSLTGVAAVAPASAEVAPPPDRVALGPIAGALVPSAVAPAPGSAAAPGTAAAPAPGGPAAVGEHSPPEWFPLRRQPDGAAILQGCTLNSPAPACSGHHPYWALDLLAAKGTVVYAAGAGQVAQLRDTETGCSSVANFVDIDHDPGYGGVWTDYWHLEEVWVTAGQWVEAGQAIGTVGETGMAPNGCGPHLHYEKLVDLWPNRVDPGPLSVCHGSERITYPQAWGHGTWEGLAWGTFTIWSDGVGCWDGPFRDVPSSHPFAAEIGWLVDEGVADGYADGTFGPTAPVSRQALAAFLARYQGAPVPAGGCPGAPFADVPADHPFCGEIDWLRLQGLATGYDDGSFRPTATVSRQAAVAMLHRLAGSPGPGAACSGAGPFADVPADHPFCTEIAWAVAAGIASGYGDGHFRGAGDVSRQAAAAFLHRYDGA
jgi:hypothetical protein